MAETTKFDFMREVVACGLGGDNRWRVLVAAWNHARADGGGIRASIPTLAAETGIAERHVRAHLKFACDAGLLVMQRKGAAGRASEYHLGSVDAGRIALAVKQNARRGPKGDTTVSGHRRVQVEDTTVSTTPDTTVSSKAHTPVSGNAHTPVSPQYVLNSPEEAIKKNHEEEPASAPVASPGPRPTRGVMPIDEWSLPAEAPARVRGVHIERFVEAVTRRGKFVPSPLDWDGAFWDLIDVVERHGLAHDLPLSNEPLEHLVRLAYVCLKGNH
ncbi:hypothetical protein FK268_22495 [Tsukamurella sputi]|uniref:Helix-turn-helix domain-containing protein n=1 Tax=Tsukamurella sputi TaxID=2591848 RepID=A0A5C5RHB3_9ACTN|nr:hypothetical protein [Tsukamurella sputi]TWS21813.1 hypothetical protein FK268_22495 [Tsukamurella sputi]